MKLCLTNRKVRCFNVWTGMVVLSSNSKTCIQLRADTILENFPLFGPKCKHETVISVKYQKILTLKEPDALTQSR